MKSTIQVVVALAVIIGGVFGVTFVSQFTRREPPPPSSAPTPDGGPVADVAPLIVREKTAVWDPNDTDYNQEIEKGQKGHYDFLVSNENREDVTVILDAKSCTCTEVLLGVVTGKNRETLKGMKSWPSGALVEPFAEGVEWQHLLREKDKPGVKGSVPAADAAGPQFAILRLAWGAKDPQAMILAADVQHRIGKKAEYTKFQVPIVIVAPVLESNNELDLGDLNPGETKSATLKLWSATRDHFPAAAVMNTPDPCIQVGEPRPLTEQELKALPEELRAAGLIRTKTRPKSGYAITVSAAESKGDNVLELGPLARRMVVNRGTDTETTVVLKGVVRGPIRIGAGAERDRINLGTFPASHGAETKIEITSTDANTQMAVDHITPDGLKAELVPAKTTFGPRRWKLTVTALPNTLAGPLPPEAAVYLKTQSTPPRRVRIPVVGNASG